MWILNCDNNSGLIIHKSCSKWPGKCSETAFKGSENALFANDMRSLVISKFVQEESLVISSCFPSASYFVQLLVKVTSGFPHFVSIKRIHLVLQLEIRNCCQKQEANPAGSVCFLHLNSRNVHVIFKCASISRPCLPRGIFSEILSNQHLFADSAQYAHHWQSRHPYEIPNSESFDSDIPR